MATYFKGEVIVFTSGCYSDYTLQGFLVAVEDLDFPSLLRDFKKDTPGETVYGRRDIFPSWLVAKGKALPVDHSEFHLGDYELDESAFEEVGR